MRYAGSRTPNPSKIPKDFRVRKVGKRVVIEEIAKPVRRRERRREIAPERRVNLTINERIRAYRNREEKRLNNQRAEISRKLIKDAINKITAEEREIHRITQSIISKITRQNYIARQAARNAAPPPTSVRPYGGPRVRTQFSNLYTHKIIPGRNIAESLTYKKLRNEGHSDRTARQLIHIFEDELEWPKNNSKKIVNDDIERWEEEALKYPPIGEAESAGYIPSSVPYIKRRYFSSVQVPVQRHRKHRPDYKLYR
jgi:hypothetical protein